MQRLFLLLLTGLLLLLPRWAVALPYEVTLSGVEDKDMAAAIRQKAMIYSLQENEPPTIAALERRTRNSVAAIEEELQAAGYFSSEVTYKVDGEADPAMATFLVEPGPRYRLGNLTIDWAGETPDLALQDIGFTLGLPATPSPILAKEQALITHLMEVGYPYPRSENRKLIVNHDTEAVDVVLKIATGDQARWGPVEIEGLKRVEEDFIRQRISWEEGDLFDIREVARTRKRLNNSGVVASVEIDYPVPEEAGAALPTTLTITERKHRSIGGGVTYSTVREFIAQIFWEHRNLFGEAEKLRTRLEVGTKTYGVTADFSKPDIFNIQKLSWQLSGEIRQEDVEAYEKEAAAVSTTLSYQYSDHSSVSGGVYLEQSQIQEHADSSEDNFTIIGLPLLYKFDTTDDLLNPREGLRFSAGVTPFYIINEQAGFYKFEFDGSHYLALGENFVWANRGRVAVIEGQSLADLPPDKRLYAGGGGSVRGYGYQLVGPLDDDNDPLGGRAAVELGTEGRYMFREKIEAVAFIDGGRVTTSTNFDSNEEFLWSAGLGGRYHTAVGPVRFDVAMPLDKRPVDDSFQFYISLGQAF